METLFRLTLASGNIKTGKIPVTTTGKDSCPASCALRGNGCYAEVGTLALHWGKEKLQDEVFLRGVANLPTKDAKGKDILWRHNQAGDLPGYNKNDEFIDPHFLRKLCEANGERRGFTYTHKNPLIADNAAAIKAANQTAFTVNLSANNIKQADLYASLDLGPVVVLLPDDAEELFETPDGNTVIACPAYKRKDLTCEQCGLCALKRVKRPHRKKRGKRVIIGFYAHGSRFKKVNAIAKGEQ